MVAMGFARFMGAATACYGLAVAVAAGRGLLCGAAGPTATRTR
ncbi:hypothetical protein AB0H60_05600 [Nocardia rhamnosiphila]|nr:hypothetical protein [Nocardia zapadnayensis]